MTARTLERRWLVHKSSAKCGTSFLLHKAIRKDGVENFSIEQIATAITHADALATERLLIQQHDCRAPGGYNMTAGGEAVPAERSASDKEKYSAAKRRRWAQVSPERRNEIREKIRKNHASHGKGGAAVQSPESIAKRAAKLRGRKQSPEEVAKRVDAIRRTFAERGYGRTPEQNAAHSARMKGRKWAPDDPRRTDPDRAAKISAGLKGRTRSAEHCAALSMAHKGRTIPQEQRERQAVAMRRHWETIDPEHKRGIYARVSAAGARRRAAKAQAAYAGAANNHLLAALGFGC